MNILEYLILTVRLPDGRHVPSPGTVAERASPSPQAHAQGR